MQCTRYIPGFYCSRNQTVDSSESLWQQLDNDICYGSGRDYNILFQPPCSDQYLAYNREILRETMLKHEAVFKYQVHELHRLYGRQMELMDETKRTEPSKQHLHVQTSPLNSFVSRMQCDTLEKASQIPCWLLLNARGDKPSAQVVGDFQNPSDFVSRTSNQADSDVYLAENHLKELEVSSCRRKKYGKILLDLELPAEEYMDSDEGEQLEGKNSAEMSQVLHDLSIRCIDSSPKSNLLLNEGASSNFNPSCRKTSCLFDLNEVMNSDEPVTTNTTCVIDLNTSSTEVIQLEQDLSGKGRLQSRVLNEVAHDILEGKGSLRSSTKSELQVSVVRKSPLSRNDNSSLDSESAKKDQDFFYTKRQRMLSPCITSSPQFVQLSDTRPSTSVSSRRASFGENSITIEAPRCFNSSEFISRTCRSSTGSSRIKEKYSYLNNNPACSVIQGSIASHISCNSNNQPTAEHYSVARCVKDSDHKNSVVHVDLNVMPSDGDGEKVYENSVEQLNGQIVESDYGGKEVACPKLSEPLTSSSHFCAVTSITSTSNSSENEDIQNGKKADIPASSMICDSLHKSENCPKGDTYLATKSGTEISKSRTDIDLCFSVNEPKPSEVSIVTAAVGTDLEAPVSPDNKEHSPPREESEDNQSEKLGDSNEDLDRVAAEAIISISLSREQWLNPSIRGPLDPSVVCLNWFAGIVSSVAGNVANGFEDLLNDALGGTCNELAPNVVEYSKTITCNLTENKVENHFNTTIDQKNKIIGDVLLPIQQGRGRARKAKEWKKFQSEVLPCASSFISYVVADNFQTIKDQTGTAKTAPKAVKARKNMGRFGRARRKHAKKFPLNVVGRSELSFLQRCSLGWGKKNIRQKNRRARNSIHLGI